MTKDQIEIEAKKLSEPILEAHLKNDSEELQRLVFLLCKEVIELRQQ